MRDVRTIHGNDGANSRADNRHRLTLLRVSRVVIALDRYQAHLPPAPSANCPLQGAPTPGPTAPFEPSRIDPLNRGPTAKSATVPFKPSRIDPLNREPMAKTGATVRFKPSRIDPLNREPDAVPDPEPRPVHRLHEPAHIRESMRRDAHAEPAPQERNLCHG
ncbi:MAG TPA: hypothetical protein VFE41_12470 [Acetobacteraceae bacterium]|nr:hypothetical protein [Acetobacteraceae bacterium]